MNKEYIYVDNKVIIIDENGEKKVAEYYDGLDDILVQENLIETLEDKSIELERKSRLYKKNNMKHYIPFFLPMTLLITTVGANLLFYGLTGSNSFSTQINTRFGTFSSGQFLSMISSILFLPVAALLEFDTYRQYKRSLKEEKGVNNELEFLKKQLLEEKQVLEDLKIKKQENNKIDEKEFKVVKVDDKQQLDTLNSNLYLYFDLGYNEEKYLKYYQQGKLDEKLKDSYNDLGIEIIKETLEEKGPTLVKRKK